MKAIAIFVLLALGITLVSLQTSKYFPEQSATGLPKLETTVGVKVLDILQHSSTITAFSVEPQKYTSLSLEVLSPTSSEISLDADLKNELLQLLLDDKHFVFGMHKRSPFLPSLVFKFSKDSGESLILAVSPSSNQMKVLMGNTSYFLDYEPSHKAVNAFIHKIENLFTQ